MFLKAILWGFLLFGVVFLGNETRQRYLVAKLDAARLQSTPLSIHESGTILKFTEKAEFEIPLLPAIRTAYENGYSESLISYLSYHHKKIVPYWLTPFELRFELDLLTDRLIRDRVFTVVNTITGQRHTSFRILPESEDYYFAYAFEDGTTFYEDEKFSFEGDGSKIEYAQIEYNLPAPVPAGGPMLLLYQNTRQPPSLQLATRLGPATPDSSTELLHLLADPDPTVY